jgi:hypothetical protein
LCRLLLRDVIGEVQGSGAASVRGSIAQPDVVDMTITGYRS